MGYGRKDLKTIQIDNPDLTEVSSQLAQIVPLKPSGDTTGVTDNSNLVNAIAAGKEVELEKGQFYFSSTLKLGKVKVRGKSKDETVLNFVNDLDCIYMDYYGQIENLTIKTCDNFTKRALSVIAKHMTTINTMVNIRAKDLVISNQNTTITTCQAIVFESDTYKGLYGIRYDNILVKGVWDKGIYNNYDYASKTYRPWIHDVLLNNIFVNTAKHIITFTYTDSTPEQNLLPSDVFPFMHHIYENVSGQFVTDKTERMFFLRNVTHTVFKDSFLYDAPANSKIIYIANYGKTKVAFDGTNHVFSYKGFIEFEANGKSHGRNLDESVINLKSTDLNKQRVILSSSEYTLSDLDVLNTPTYDASMRFVTAPDDYRTVYDGTDLFWRFNGFAITNSTSVPSPERGHFQLGLNGSRQLIIRAFDGTSWSPWNLVYNDNAMPSGVSTARTKKPSVGSMFFDNTLGKPIWCKTKAVVDSSGNITTQAVWVDSTGTTV